MTGILQRRSVRRVQTEKVNAFLATLLAERAMALGERNVLQNQIRTIVDGVPVLIASFDHDLAELRRILGG